MKPIIGIVTRPIVSKENSNLNYVSDDLRKAIIKYGGIPISILSTENKTYDLDNYQDEKLSTSNKKDLEKILKLCDGIIFQGGSKFYSYDKYIAKYVIENDIPALGLCLGMQLLNHVDNNDKSFLLNNENHYQKNKECCHEIKLIKNTLLDKIIKKDSIKVNSRHHLSIIKLNNFRVCARSLDNTIESIYYPGKRFILGVQFHPENNYEDCNYKLIFKSFIKECQNVR